MSVPSSAYDTKVFSDLTASQDYKWAKLLSEYGGWSGVKQKFYLDEVLEGNEGGVTYFIGSCIPGSPNSKYHRSDRLREVFHELRLYDDAGLNTLGYSDLGNNTNEPRWVNWINFAFYIKSAYYLNSTGTGYSYRINSGTWTDVSFGITPPIAKTILHDVFPQIDLSANASEGDTIGLRVWVSNAEGTSYSSEYNFTALEPLAIPTGANVYDTPGGSIIDTVTIFMLSSTESALSTVTTSDANTGLYLYYSEYFTTSNPSAGDIVDNGWYVIGGVPTLPNGNTKVFQVVSGQIRKYTERVLTVRTIVFTCINDGSIDFPTFRSQATIMNDTTPPSGFARTVATSVTIKYMDNSNNVLASHNSNITLTQGNTSAFGSYILIAPPSGTTKAQAVCVDNEAKLGMPKSEPITTLNF